MIKAKITCRSCGQEPSGMSAYIRAGGRSLIIDHGGAMWMTVDCAELLDDWQRREMETLRTENAALLFHADAMWAAMDGRDATERRPFFKVADDYREAFPQLETNEES